MEITNRILTADKISGVFFKQLDIPYMEVDTSIPAFKISDMNENAGIDMILSEDTWVWPFRVYKLKLNIIIEIPPNYYGRIAPRSGMTDNQYITVPGTIDPGYRGQPHCQIFRLGIFPKLLKKGTRVCQLIIQPYVDPNLIKANELSSSKRGVKGFGSSGHE